MFVVVSHIHHLLIYTPLLWDGTRERPVQLIYTYRLNNFRFFQKPIPDVTLASNNQPSITASIRIQCYLFLSLCLSPKGPPWQHNEILPLHSLFYKAEPVCFSAESAQVTYIIRWLSGWARALLDQHDLEGTFTFQSCQVFNLLVNWKKEVTCSYRIRKGMKRQDGALQPLSVLCWRENL